MSFRLATVRQRPHQLDRPHFKYMTVRLDPVSVVFDIAFAVLSTLGEEQSRPLGDRLAQIVRPLGFARLADSAILLADEFRDPRRSECFGERFKNVLLRTSKYIALEDSESCVCQSAVTLSEQGSLERYRPHQLVHR